MTRSSVVPKARTSAAGGGRDRAAAGTDPWFRALDGRVVQAGADAWIVEVTAVYRSLEDVYVQVAPVGEPQLGFVLRMALQATAAHAVAALEARTALPPGERPHLLDVMRVASTEDRRPLPVC